MWFQSRKELQFHVFSIKSYNIKNAYLGNSLWLKWSIIEVINITLVIKMRLKSVDLHGLLQPLILSPCEESPHVGLDFDD
jgi:hypothetical protein